MLSVEEFTQFIVECWEKTPTNHFFSVNSSRIPSNSHIAGTFRVQSLEECLTSYSWNGKGFKENDAKLGHLQGRLQQSLREKNVDLAASSFKEIYQWGGVRYKGNISGSWLCNSFQDRTLIDKITDSIDILKTGQNLDKFDGQNLIMNSGYTKVASLAAPRENPLIIYDGRVGAALGDLVAMAMQSKQKKMICSELCFPWGGARGKGNSRNPSTDKLKFPRLFGGHASHMKHARAMHNASKIVIRATECLGIRPREMEAALFMWGYDIRYKRGHESE